jgi:flagellar protein FlaJ
MTAAGDTETHREPATVSDFHLSSPNTIEATFLPIATRVIDEYDQYAAALDKRLTQARRDISLELFIAQLFGWAASAAVATSGTVLIVTALLFIAEIATLDPWIPITAGPSVVQTVVNGIQKPVSIILVTIVIGGGVGLTVAATIVFLPIAKARSRAREIDVLLPDTVSFMYALSVGGMNQLDILRAVASAEETYGEVSREFQAIIQKTEYTGEDYRSALRQAAITTPSEELSQFITDMLSIISSGGSIEDFLGDQKDAYIDQARQKEEDSIELIELSGEIFITLSVAPVMLLIILLVMELLGTSTKLLMFLSVYLVTPIISIAYLILISTIQPDDFGSGKLSYNGEIIDSTEKRYDISIDDVYELDDSSPVFGKLQTEARSQLLTELLTKPHLFIRDNPLYTLFLTAPLALGGIGIAIITGAVPTRWEAFTTAPIVGTAVYYYIPLYVIGGPLAAAYLWNSRHYQTVSGNLTDHLRKISSANDTGQTLLESFNSVADNSTDQFAADLGKVAEKVKYGGSVRRSLIELNNKHADPELARIIRLITKAHETSGQISDVLSTAAQITENRQKIQQQRKTATATQVIIVIMTFMVMVGVLGAIQFQFVGLIADIIEQAASQSGGGSGAAQRGGSGQLSFSNITSPDILTTVFFHALVIQGSFAGLSAGYMRTGKLRSGIKFILMLATLPLAAWSIIIHVL